MPHKPQAVRAGGALAAVVLCTLLGLHPDVLSGDFAARIGGGFHPGHAWALDRVAEMMWSDAAWSGDGTPMGYPETGHIRLIGWGALLTGAVWVPIIGLLPAYHLALLLTVLLTAWITTALIQRICQVPTMTAAGAALVYALSPMALGFLANGQLAKLHMWCMPLTLLLADIAVRDSRRWWALIGVGSCSALTGFSSPSVALLLPFALAVWVLLRAQGPRRWGWVLAVLSIAAAGLLLPMLYHQMPGEGVAVLKPASPIPGLVHPDWLSPVARPAELFFGQAPWSSARDGVNNISYLGLPALLGALALARGSQARSLGACLALVGIILALGPAIDAPSVRWVLPAAVLEWCQYPIIQSGMYYRFAQVASLGLALLIAGSMQRKGGAGLAWSIGALNIAAGLWATQALWPRPVPVFDGHAIYAQMAADPTPGAVLDLPLETIDTDGSKAALAQALHGRHSTALVHNVSAESSPRLKTLANLVRTIHSGASPRRALADQGFRYVVLRPTRGQGGNAQHSQALRRALGTPAQDNGVMVWTIPPAP